jgi:hypothetical protein
VCAKIDGSWDNLFQLCRKLGTLIWGTIGSFASSLMSLLGESLQLKEAAPAAVGVAISAAIIAALYAVSAGLDALLPPLIGSTAAKDFKDMWDDVFNESANTLVNVSSYFENWTNETKIGDKLAAIAQSIRSNGDTRAALVDLKTLSAQVAD